MSIRIILGFGATTKASRCDWFRVPFQNDSFHLYYCSFLSLQLPTLFTSKREKETLVGYWRDLSEIHPKKRPKIFYKHISNYSYKVYAAHWFIFQTEVFICGSILTYHARRLIFLCTRKMKINNCIFISFHQKFKLSANMRNIYGS